jgi:serine phosphatase RsbU (regulator of sigma subunit)
MPRLSRNPYLNRSMVRDTGAFFGRRRELARLADRLACDPPQSVAIIGDRRIGKSSLLYCISRPAVYRGYLDDPDRALLVLLDLQQQQRPSVASFVEALVDGVRPTVAWSADLDVARDGRGLRDLVGRLHRRGYRLILLLDEFDRVTRSASFEATFFSLLRSLAGEYNLAYVTATTRDLQQLCRTQEISDSPFFNVFSTLHLGPFTDDEALALIREPSAATLHPLEAHADLLLELGGCLPLFLQIACSAAFEVLAEEGEWVPALVETRCLEEARPHFNYLWEQMGPVQRSLCGELADERRVDVGRPEYQNLVRRGLVQLRGRLFSTLFAAFVRQIHERETGSQPAEVQAERLRNAEEELEKAHTMQMALMPHANPVLPGLELAGRCEPATHVGGDFFTYVWLDTRHERLALVGVDVMGHGMEGALTAVRFSETLRYEARNCGAAGELLEGLNRSLCGILPAGTFVACGIVVIDMPTLSAEVATAGYYPPLHWCRADGGTRQPDLGGTPLGVRSEARYRSATLSLQPGDWLLLYSDGLVEATDDRDAAFGEERLRDLLASVAAEGLTAPAALDRVFWDVHRFTASTGRQDDVTVIVLKVADCGVE